jgi:Protein of unknown function (DUF2783)
MRAGGDDVQHLNTEPHFHTPAQAQRYTYTAGDNFYELLIQGHDGLSNAQSELMNARLVLLLANHVGDLRVLQEAITAARAGLQESTP